MLIAGGCCAHGHAVRPRCLRDERGGHRGACARRLPAATLAHVLPQRLYHIKGRDAAVPLAVCVADPQVRAVAASVKVWRLSQMQDVPRYARTDHLPPGLLHSLLPGETASLHAPLRRR